MEKTPQRINNSATNSPTKIDKYESLELPSINSVLNTDNRSISSLAREKGVEPVLKAILVHLNKYLSFVGKDLSEEQKIELCQMIYTTYPYYNPEHIRLFFYRAKTGRYGDISFGDINGAVIMGFLLKFDKEIDEEISVHNKNLSRIHKENDSKLNIPSNETDPKKAKAWDLLKKDLIQIGKEKDNNKTKPSIKFAPMGQEEPTSDLVQDWIKEFDELYKQTGKLGEHPKQIIYEGERLGLLEFIELKQKDVKL